jgi:thiamine pyrophosphate-dependent acetolactate synthase large subunit-like protein
MDFATIARGMGCHGIRVDRADALGDAIVAARQSDLPTVIDVAIDPEVRPSMAGRFEDIQRYEGQTRRT